jgi:hypothetical protein
MSVLLVSIFFLVCIWSVVAYTKGADKSFGFVKKTRSYGAENYVYSTYPPPSSTHLRLRCSNFFNSSKKNSFGCAANRKSQKLTSTLTYKEDGMLFSVCHWCSWERELDVGVIMSLGNMYVLETSTGQRGKVISRKLIWQMMRFSVEFSTVVTII